MDKPTSKRSHVRGRGGAGQAGRQRLKRWNGRMTEWRVRSDARRWEGTMFVKGYAWTTLEEEEERQVVVVVAVVVVKEKADEKRKKSEWNLSR